MRHLFLIFILLDWVWPKPAYSSEVYRYFSAPAYVHTFEHLEAKIWIILNRIPELKWQKVEIPPVRKEVSLLPKVIFVSGKFTKEGKGNRSLFVNGTKVKVADSGEFILRVLIESNDFGLLVALKDLDDKEEKKQTVGVRVHYNKKEENPFAKSRKTADFAGRSVFTQRRTASLDLFPIEPEPPPNKSSAEVEVTKEKEKLSWLDLYFGSSLGSYKQHTFDSQSPKNAYLRVDYEHSLKETFRAPIFVGFDGRLSLLSLAQEKNGTLQFINPEVRIGLKLIKTQKTSFKISTGTSYFSSFGNSLYGLKSALGQSVQAKAQFNFSEDWRLTLVGRATWIPGGATSSSLSNHEL
ncbi:hypothetical protein EBT16_11785, partial [bacterium]|nr:hypothetical protein [bacterium]